MPDHDGHPHAARGKTQAANDDAFSRIDPGAGILASSTTPAERRRGIQILFISLVCVGTGQSLFFAILPPLARDLGLSEFQVGAIFAVSATIWVFSSPYWGTRSDHMGRKPVMLMGLMAFAVSTALFASAILAGLDALIPAALVYPAMIASRAIYGALGSGTFAAAQAYVADRTTRAERAGGVAMIGAAFGLGTTIGPGIGSALVILGLLAPFYFVAVAAAASAAAVWFFLPERTAPTIRHERPPLKWRDARVFPFLLFGLGLSTAGAIPIQTVGFFFMDVLELDASDTAQFVGIGLMASSMAALFAQLVLVQRFSLSSRALIRWGVVLALISNLLFLVGVSFGLLVLALVFAGLGFGMARPGFAAAASLAVEPDEQGAVAGLTGATSGAGFIFGPLIGNALYEVAPIAPYIFGAALMVALLAYAMASPRLRAAGAYTPKADGETPETAVPKP